MNRVQTDRARSTITSTCFPMVAMYALKTDVLAVVLHADMLAASVQGQNAGH